MLVLDRIDTEVSKEGSLHKHVLDLVDMLAGENGLGVLLQNISTALSAGGSIHENLQSVHAVLCIREGAHSSHLEALLSGLKEDISSIRNNLSCDNQGSSPQQDLGIRFATPQPQVDENSSHDYTLLTTKLDAIAQKLEAVLPQTTNADAMSVDEPSLAEPSLVSETLKGMQTQLDTLATEVKTLGTVRSSSARLLRLPRKSQIQQWRTQTLIGQLKKDADDRANQQNEALAAMKKTAAKRARFVKEELASIKDLLMGQPKLALASDTQTPRATPVPEKPKSQGLDRLKLVKIQVTIHVKINIPGYDLEWKWRKSVKAEECASIKKLDRLIGRKALEQSFALKHPELSPPNEILNQIARVGALHLFDENDSRYPGFLDDPIQEWNDSSDELYKQWRSSNVIHGRKKVQNVSFELLFTTAEGELREAQRNGYKIRQGMGKSGEAAMYFL